MWHCLQSSSMKRDLTTWKNKICFFQNFLSSCPRFPHDWYHRQTGSCIACRVSWLVLTQPRPPDIPRPGTFWSWALKKTWVDHVWYAGRKAAARDLRFPIHVDLVTHHCCVTSFQTGSFQILPLGHGEQPPGMFFTAFSNTVWCWV